MRLWLPIWQQWQLIWIDWMIWHTDKTLQIERQRLYAVREAIQHDEDRLRYWQNKRLGI